MRLMFATTIPYLPHNTGGMLTSTHALALRLQQRGVAVAAFAGQPGVSSVRASDPADRSFAVDHTLGYPVYRARRPVAAYADVLADWRPDIAILPFGAATAPLAALGLDAGVKAVLYAHSVEPRDLGGVPIARPDVTLIANSSFTARRLETVLGTLPPVVTPLIEPDLYRVAPAGDAVLLVNPTLLKGSEIFFRLAEARPMIRFLAVESWSIGDDWRTVLGNRARGLGNIELWPPVEDMRVALAQTRLVLMPSAHEETFGRAVAEAQVSGIPALVSDRGALSETVGAGGAVVALDAGFAAWVAALDRIWHDAAAYRKCAAAAAFEAQRPERAPEHVADRFLEILRGFA
jgi:glycosyltransferase involved in cell wall biosynthesis